LDILERKRINVDELPDRYWLKYFQIALKLKMNVFAIFTMFIIFIEDKTGECMHHYSVA
jgi:hypothetical protein